MKSGPLAKRSAAALPEEVRALLDALPIAAMLSAADGEVLHENAAMREASEPATRDVRTLTLPGIGECTLALSRPTDAQTQRLAALGFMLAGVCHEVSNPLAAIHSMLQILQSKRGVSRETLDKGLASIAANITRVLAITRKLGDFSRVGGESPAPVSLDAAMDAARVLLRHSEEGARVSVAYDGAPDARVLARAGQLEQVLYNILLNAAQAMRANGHIDAQARTVDGERALLTIRDSGPGIAPEHLARVFEPFFSTKPAGEGTGLGLAICNQIVQELGGAMRAYNHPEGGACFELTLPLWRIAP